MNSLKQGVGIAFLSLVILVFGSYSFFHLPISSGVLVSQAVGSTSGLVAHYALDGAPNDSTGNNSALTINNTTWSSGKVGTNALSFTGAYGSYAQTPGSIAVSASGFSFSFWINTPSGGFPTGGIISWNDQRMCRFGGVAVNTINCSVTGSSNGSAFTTSQLNDGNWHHIVFNSTANAQQLYVDGSLQGSAIQSLATTPGFLTLGSFAYGSGALNAIIDDVRIYDHPLTTTEISSLFALAGTNPAPITPPASTYTLTVTNQNSVGGSFITNPTNLTSLSSGTSVTITASPNTNYTTTWSGCGSVTSGNTCTVIVTANTSVSVNFTEITVEDPPVAAGMCEASLGHKCWYVDNAVSGGSANGSSWGNAWRSLGAIVWSSVQPGDYIYISGGSGSKIYNERIEPKKGGISGSPITIKVGQDSGHNGMVIIDRNFTNYYGILIKDVSNVTVSGQVGSDPNPHMKITRALEHGVQIHGSVTNTHLSYLEITKNGNAYPSYGLNMQVVQSPQLGELDHLILHDNYSDEMELALSGTPEQQLAVSGSINYFGSLKVHDNEIYNWHADAVKIFLAGVDFYNNTIRDRGVWRADHPDGIQYWSSYVRIFNNRFYNFGNTEFVSNDSGPNSYLRYEPAQIPNVNVDSNPRHMYIYNNLFYETRAPGPGQLLRGIELSWWPQYWNTTTGSYASAPGPNIVNLVVSVSHIYIMNNTFVNVPFIPIIVSTAGHTGNYISDVIIENNIIKDSCHKTVCSGVLSLTKGTGTNVTYGGHGSGANVIVDYNSISGSSALHSFDIDFSGPGVTTILSYPSFKTTCSGCQVNDVGSPTTNPLLDLMFKLQSNSPLIDRGVSQGTLFTTDFSGGTRPQGNGWDIGAYESGSVGSAAPITFVAGDFNKDGYVNSIDFSLMSAAWNTSNTVYDLNKDGAVNTLDYSIMVRNWTN